MNKTDIHFKYDTLTKIFHWASAVIILWALFSGFIVFQTIKNESVLHFVEEINVSITLLLIPIFILRIINRLNKYKFEKENKHNFAAYLVHVFIYAITIFILVSGVLMINGDVNCFGMTLFTNTLNNTYTNWFGIYHTYACMLLGGLVLLHILAVIKHHLSGYPIMLKMI